MIKIQRRFRREMRQELRMGGPVRRGRLVALGIVGLVLAKATRGMEAATWVHYLGYPLLLVGLYLAVRLAFAQIRARAQPFDHTLVIGEQGISITDNYRRATTEHDWSDFERCGIDARHFVIRRRGAEQGEEYLIDRSKLSAVEERFLGERLVEL